MDDTKKGLYTFYSQLQNTHLEDLIPFTFLPFGFTGIIMLRKFPLFVAENILKKGYNATD